jgi:hypothetical protein
MAERKRRTDEHPRADVAVKVVQLAIARAGYVSIVGEQGSDYGVDLTVRTFDDDGYAENGAFHIQVKAVTRTKPLADGFTIAYGLDRRDPAHWLSEPDPVILVVYDATADKAHWVYVQRYFANRGFTLRDAGERVTIRLDLRDVFDLSAVREIGRLNRLLRQRSAGRIHHG